MQTHTLDAGANTDLDHASADLVGDIDAGLQARRALAVEGAHGRGLGEPGDESSGAHLGGATARRQHLTYAHIFYERRVDAGTCDYALQYASHQIRRRRVLECALAALCEGRAQACRDNDLEEQPLRLASLSAAITGPQQLNSSGRAVVVKGIIAVMTYIIGVLLEDPVPGGLGARDLARDLR